LLVGVPRHEAAAGPKRHVHEPGAIDARTRHPTPLVARIQERARMLDGIVRHGPEPVGITLAAEVRAPDPGRIRVIRLDENPVVALLEHPQRLACQGLCHLLEDATYVVVDLETTGLRPGQSGICEIGAVRLRGFEVDAEFQTLVDPGLPIAAGVSALTGLRSEQLRGAPNPADAVRGFLAFV